MSGRIMWVGILCLLLAGAAIAPSAEAAAAKAPDADGAVSAPEPEAKPAPEPAAKPPRKPRDAEPAKPAPKTSPADAAKAAEPAPASPTGLRLTPLQEKILGQTFVQHPFEDRKSPSADEPFDVEVTATEPGAVYRLGPVGDLPAKLKVHVTKAGAPVVVNLAWKAVDFYGRKVAEGTLPPEAVDAAGKLAAELELKDLLFAGYFHVYVTATAEGRKAVGGGGLVIVPPFDDDHTSAGPFGVAMMGPVEDDAAEICHRLGATRVSTSWVDGRDVANFPDKGPLPEDWRPEFEWEPGEKSLDQWRGTGLVPMGVIRPGRLAERLHAPAASAASNDPATPGGRAPLPALLSAISVEHYAKSIPDWQVGDGPFVGGVPWPGTAPAYRNMLEGLIREVRGLKVPAALWVGATPSFVADVLSEAGGLKEADGVSLVVDAGARSASLRSGAFRRSVDFGIQAARRFGLKRVLIGATGDDPFAGSPQQQAWKLVTRHVLALACGAEGVYVEYARGLPTPLPAAAAYAQMTRMLDGLAYDGDLWEDVPLLQAHLFSGAKRRVAVVWSWAGADPAAPDRGALIFNDGFGLEAFDLVGHSVGLPKGRRLIVPLGEAPIYVVGKDLRAQEMRDRFRQVEVIGISPVTAWVSGVQPTDTPHRMRVTLWLQAHRPRRVDAVASLLAPDGWTVREAKQRASLGPGQVAELVFDCDVAKDPGPGPYRIEAAVQADGEWTRRVQEVQAAWIPKREIRAGLGMAEWAGIAPVRLRGDAAKPSAEVRVAYDASFFYFVARVAREHGGFIATSQAYGGDAIQLAFGLAPRADDDFGHVLPVLPPGAFRDTDHLFALTMGETRAELVRLRGSGAVLRTHLDGNADPWYGPVDGAQASVQYDEAAGVMVYEAAIPMAALQPLKPAAGQTLRFSFRIGDGKAPPLDWARAAGVPDYLANPTSFLPTTDAEALPCQTRWILTGPAVREEPEK